VNLIGSADSKSREESARLLGCLIKACERLMGPYIVPVLQVSCSLVNIIIEKSGFSLAISRS
jgi:hypothetical protein